MNAIRTFQRASAAVAVLWIANALAHAQYHPIPPTPLWPYKTLVSGDLDGNLSAEIAVIHGNQLRVFQNPATSPESYVIAEDAIDVCYWPNAEGGAPGLLYTNPDGLAVATFDPNYDGSGAPYFVALHPYPLQGVLRVRHVPDDGGVEKFFFLKNDAKSFYSANVIAGVISAPTFHFTLPGAMVASDFVILDFANPPGDPGLDIGILTNIGVRVQGQNNSLLMSRGAIYPGQDAIARVRHPSGSGWKDSLAFVTRLAGQLPNLLLFNPLFYTPQNPTNYVKTQLSTSATVLYGSVTAEDVNGDGIEDVVMGRTISKIDVQRLGNPAAPGSVFVGELGTCDMSLAGGTTTAMGRIVCADLFNETVQDQDPYTDVPLPGFAAMLTDLNGLRLAQNYKLDFPDMPQQLPPGLEDFEWVTYESSMTQRVGGCAAAPPNEQDVLPRARWTIGIGPGWGLIQNATHMELIVRRCPPETQNPLQTALAHLVFQIPSPPQVTSAEVTFLAAPNENTVANWDLEALDSRHFAMVRPIQLSEGQITRAWRWSILGMSASCDGEDWLETIGTGVPIPIDPTVCDVDFGCAIGLGGGENRLPPKAVPQSSIPPSPGGVLPIIPPFPYP